MTTGTIVYYKNESGFGFIVPTGFDRNDRDNNIFFHVKNVVGYQPGMDVPVGANVSYEKGEGKKGIEAFNVSIMEDEQEEYADNHNTNTGKVVSFGTPRATQEQDYGMAA